MSGGTISYYRDILYRGMRLVGEDIELGEYVSAPERQRRTDFLIKRIAQERKDMDEIQEDTQSIQAG